PARRRPRSGPPGGPRCRCGPWPGWRRRRPRAAGWRRPRAGGGARRAARRRRGCPRLPGRGRPRSPPGAGRGARRRPRTVPRSRPYSVRYRGVWFATPEERCPPHARDLLIFRTLGRMVDWVVQLMELLGAPGAGVAVALENLFPPIPSEVILPLSG